MPEIRFWFEECDHGEIGNHTNTHLASLASPLLLSNLHIDRSVSQREIRPVDLANAFPDDVRDKPIFLRRRSLRARHHPTLG